MDLLVALQTHNVSNNQDTLHGTSFVRYGCQDKTEIVKRCTRSLIASMNEAQRKLPEWTFRLHIFDDHSTDEGLHILHDNMSRANFEVTLTNLPTRGIIPSLRTCYDDLHTQGKELVMQAQDDYLFHPSCFSQLILTWLKFSPRFPKPLSLFPFDDPYRYVDHNIVPVRIVQGPDRHWRQTYQVPCTFFTHHQVITREWDLFDAMCSGDPHDPQFEDKTVNKLWQEREYVVMSPIPSLALHFQADTEKDPYLDWQSWWEPYADARQPIPSNELFNTDVPIVLNVGCGSTPLNQQSGYFGTWKEIRVDTESNPTVDLVNSITDLSSVPSHSVDAIWASHVLEHNYWHEVPTILRTMLRVLKSNGFAVIRVPDLGSIADRIPDRLLDPVYESSSGPIAPIDMIYSARWLVEQHGNGMAHKTGFTEQSMRTILSALQIRHTIKKGSFELHVIIFPQEPPMKALCHPDLIW